MCFRAWISNFELLDTGNRRSLFRRILIGPILAETNRIKAVIARSRRFRKSNLKWPTMASGWGQLISREMLRPITTRNWSRLWVERERLRELVEPYGFEAAREKAAARARLHV